MRSPVIVALIGCAIVVDAAIGTFRIGAPAVPLATLCVVASIALAGGPSAGMLAGFGAGVVLDLTAGPASPGGVHALVGLALGVSAGTLRPRMLGPAGAGIAVGAPAVAIGAAVTLGLQGTLVPTTTAPLSVPAIAAVAGAVACPMVVRMLVGPLSQWSRAA